MVTVFALHTDASIYKMVENAYKVTLVAAIVPLTFGLYWHRATSLGRDAGDRVRARDLDQPGDRQSRTAWCRRSSPASA